MSKLDFHEIDLKYLKYLKTYGDSKVPNYDYKNICLTIVVKRVYNKHVII